MDATVRAHMPAVAPLLPRRAAPVAAVLLLLALLTAAAPADAAIPWAACATAGYECATVDVPLDRAGAVAGTVSLSATRVPAATNPGRSAVVALAGGPGQAALPLAADFAQVL